MPNDIDLKKIEQLELKYLNKFYHFLKSVEDEMLLGFETKEKVKNDWYAKYNSGISDFAVGAERIVYSLINGQGIGQPNSMPVGSDLCFETKDAFIHIDLKTVQTRNISDYNTSIFIGDNQNSYQGTIVTSKDKRKYQGNLPTYYTLPDKSIKYCLTYFVTILYEDKNLNILNINLLSCPNGTLNKVYGDSILRAGKNKGKIRFNFANAINFKLLNNKRLKVIYFDNKMDKKYLKNLELINSLNSL